MRTICCLVAAVLAMATEAVRAEEYVGCGHLIAPPTVCYGCATAADNCACDFFGTGTCNSDQQTCLLYKRGMYWCEDPMDPTCFRIYKECVTCWHRKHCNNQSGIDGGACDNQYPYCFSTDEYSVAECGGGCTGGSDCGYRYFHNEEACVE